MKAKKEFLYNDLETFKYFKSKEAVIENKFNTIKEQAIQIVGDIEIDYIKLMHDKNYICDLYVNNYKPNKPKHIKSEIVIENETGIELSQFYKNVDKVKGLISDFGRRSPEITKQGFKSNIDKKDFDKYLNEVKREEYELIKEFSNAINNLNNFRGVDGEPRAFWDTSILYAKNLLTNDGYNSKISFNYFV